MRGILIESFRGALIRIFRMIIYVVLIIGIVYLIGLVSSHKEETKRSGINASEIEEKF